MAPSRVKDAELIPVTQYIFGVGFCSNSEIKEFLEKYQLPDSQEELPTEELQEASDSVATPSHPSQHTAVQPDDKLYHTILTDMCRLTHNLREEEPPGYLPLGCLVVYFGKLLSTRLNAIYNCHPQRSVAKNVNPGQNPSTDVAIVLRSLGTIGYISRVLYEYKPGGTNLLAMVDTKHLVELLLQCY